MAAIEDDCPPALWSLPYKCTVIEYFMALQQVSIFDWIDMMLMWEAFPQEQMVTKECAKYCRDIMEVISGLLSS